MESNTERNIPADIKRSVRTEAHFGCAVCGAPIIEYHHIIPFHIVQSHDVENLIALCPTDHYKADRGMIPKEKLRQLKINPYNKHRNIIKDGLFIGNYDKLQINLGNSTFIRTENLLVIDDVPLISIKPDEYNNVIMSAKFYDKTNRLVAEICENEWITHLKEDQVWDVQYTSGKLKINSSKKKIFLEFQAKPEENKVNIRANLFYKGSFFDINPTKILAGMNVENTILYNTLSGFTIVGAKYGMCISTK